MSSAWKTKAVFVSPDHALAPALQSALGDAGIQVHSHCLAGEVEHVGGGQVCLDILLEDLHELLHLGQGVPGDHFLGQGHQHLALHLRPAHVGVTAPVVVVAEADHLHGLLTVQVVLALGVVDVQVLIGVVIVHLLRDIDVHPLQLVHQGHESLQVHIDVVVDGDAEGLLDLLLQHVHPRPA